MNANAPLQEELPPVARVREARQVFLHPGEYYPLNRLNSSRMSYEVKLDRTPRHDHCILFRLGAIC